MPNRPVHDRAARALRRRPPDELRRVYTEHVSAVFGFFGHSVSRAHAEDLTSATFERVIRAWRDYDPARASERTWIMAIARNQLTDHYRRQRHRDGVSLDEHPLLLDVLVADDPTERGLTRAEVASWLRELAPRDRQVLALRYGADLPARDISTLTDLSEANVHQIISRTLRRLRESAVRTLT